jgi:hypothetical protein
MIARSRRATATPDGARRYEEHEPAPAAFRWKMATTHRSRAADYGWTTTAVAVR